jgi:hypothetical protein
VRRVNFETQQNAADEVLTGQSEPFGVSGQGGPVAV